MQSSLQLTSTLTADDVSEHPFGTALVLGEGGSAGNALLIGVIAGLLDDRLDVTKADLIIGTSGRRQDRPLRHRQLARTRPN